MEAQFIRKYYGTGFDKNYIYYDYEYRGHEYTVYVCSTKGNEPLSWQHKNEQARIDNLIELEQKQKENDTNIMPADKAIDKLFGFWEGETTEEIFEEENERI